MDEKHWSEVDRKREPKDWGAANYTPDTDWSGEKEIRVLPDPEKKGTEAEAKGKRAGRAAVAGFRF